VRRHDNFSASYSFHPAQKGKILTQTDLFYSYQCNEPIFEVENRRKSHEKSLQTFYAFCKKSFVAMTTFQRHIHSIRLRTERFFQHRLIYFIHTNAMNPFSKLTIGETVMNSRYKLFLFAKNCASSWQLFSVIFIPSGSEGKDFSTQTDLFFSYQCNGPIFKVDNWGNSHVKSLQTFNTFCEKSCLKCTWSVA